MSKPPTKAPCSWSGCEQAGVHIWKATDGEEWSKLCDEHHAKLDNSIDAGLKEPSEANIKALLSGWIRAQGGAKAATKRMLGGDDDQ